MKTERNMLIAFVLNLTFSVLECLGGLYTGSVAILSDALHDMGDAASIGLSCFLERVAKKPQDRKHTYGYARYSVMGGWITTLLLSVGSVMMLIRAVSRLLRPAETDVGGMILLATIGVFVNFVAALLTREGDSLNQRAVNLHMLEDVLGWVVVWIGGMAMHFTGLSLLDPLLSIGVSVFILVKACGNLRDMTDLFLEKAPRNIGGDEIQAQIEQMDGVLQVHHLHLWSMDGQRHCATLHIVADGEILAIKKKVRDKLREHGVEHVTIETEAAAETCSEIRCCLATHLHRFVDSRHSHE